MSKLTWSGAEIFSTMDTIRSLMNTAKLERFHYWVYIVECNDGTFYTGSTNDLDQRITAHNNKRGARYTAQRSPVSLVYSEKCNDLSSALKREYALKKLSHHKKQQLADGFLRRRI